MKKKKTVMNISISLLLDVQIISEFQIIKGLLYTTCIL